MRDETIIDVYTSGVNGAEYDAGMKQLMSNKEIIIPILQMTVPEFKMCSQCRDLSSSESRKDSDFMFARNHCLFCIYSCDVDSRIINSVGS